MRRHIAATTLLAAALFAGAPAAHADTLGQDVTFNVNHSFDAFGAQSISATARAIGQNAYFYVDDRFWASLGASQQTAFLDRLNELASQFDAVIWPRETTFWGMPNTPGVDNDPRITVLLEDLSAGSGGYFDTINGYPKNRAPDSNAREMVVIAADSVIPGSAKSFVAHEFQHLISFNQKELIQDVSDDTWLNEARSEYSITLDGYDDPFPGSTLQRRIQTFVRTPNDSLTDWPNTSTDYGVASVFIHYLADRFGQSLVQSTIHDRAAGASAVQDWLSANQPGMTFGSVFADWMVDDTTNPSIMLVPPQTMFSASTQLAWSPTATEWQPEWLNVQVPSSLPTDVTMTVAAAGADPWFADIVASYGTSTHTTRWDSTQGSTITIPASDGTSALRSVLLAFAQGSVVPADGRTLSVQQAVVTLAAGSSATVATPTPIATPAPAALKDGDLIRRIGQADVYVIWGHYRRYMTPGTLALYGFQSRTVTPVSDGVFFGYDSSNYVRAIDQQKVYAVWPDGTKHWLHITPAQWDASGRDWNAIFIVNDAEVAFYATGVDITR